LINKRFKDLNIPEEFKSALTPNTDGIIHKLVTVFAGSLLSPGILPTAVPGYPTSLRYVGQSAQLHVRQFCNRGKFLLSIEVCEPGAAPLLSTRFLTGDKFVIPI
jgi:hypothetical protein